MRVIVHAGFHKTGTSSVQRALRANRAALKPHVRMVMRPGMVALCEAARAYSADRDALNLAMFTYELAQLAEAWNPADARPMLLASEDLCGHMPGRKGVRTYSAAPKLMAVMVETLASIRPQAAPEFHFSTRGTDAWLRSCYAQHLQASRITQSRDDYAAAFAGSADLDSIIGRIAESTDCPVHSATLEESTARRLGPLDPLLDMIGVPDNTRAALRPSDHANATPDRDVLAALLDMNRSTLSDDDLRAAKRRLLRPAA